MNERYSFPSVQHDGLTLILGLGETGVAAARWCAAQGGRLRILDTREQPAGLDALQAAGVEAELHLGPDALVPEALVDVHTLVLSPGLNPHQAPVLALLAAARERGIDVLGEIEFFARALADLRAQGYAPQVAAVTGTNGKTTVTSLVRHLAQACGRPVRAAGNIGPAALASLHEALDQDSLPEIWVLELSSFQLETTTSLAVDVGVVLNLTQDHLDWHGSMQAYADAKARLLKLSRVAVVNRDDAWVRAMVDDLDDAAVRSFGGDAPVLGDDLGLVVRNGLTWLAHAAPADGEPVTTRSRKDLVPAPRTPGQVQLLMPADALQIRGRHNALNALAALSLGATLGLPWASMLYGLRDYRGEAHRTELIRSIAGVDFIDDSKGTNVGATLAALQGQGRPVVLIAGGLGKGQDFSPLTDAVRNHARAVLLIGEDGPRIAAALVDCGVALESCTTLEEAVERGMALAQPGDAVLLSPACASMDMFRNYAHRSACFVAAVRELAIERGEVA